MSEAVIKLDNIVKSYGKHDVLKGVTMQVNKGDIYGLVGKNGAGKTTIFKMILGLSEYTSGNVSIIGSTNKRELFANRRKVGFFVGSNFYGYLSARDNLQYYARAKGIPHGKIKDEITRVLDIVGLEDSKKLESLKYWIGIWDAKGAKIDGINAKLNLTYSEDAATQEANKATLDNLLVNLASTGKLIRLSNLDIKYQDATGASVTAKDITEGQRQQLADYYAYVIKSYMNKIPNDKQAGLCKGNLVDTTDPVGLWSIDNKDWVRTAIYKAFCDALSGK